MLLNSLGILATEGRRWVEALDYFERSLELKRKIGHQRSIHITIQNQAVVLMALGQLDEARQLMEKVLKFSLEIVIRRPRLTPSFTWVQFIYRLGAFILYDPPWRLLWRSIARSAAGWASARPATRTG